MFSDSEVTAASQLRPCTRRSWSAACRANLWALGILAATTSPRALADDVAAVYPTKSIQFIVPFPPGGLTDRLSRVLTQKLSESWGQPVIVLNKPGAGGTIGMAALAKSKPDGYTIGLGSHATHAINVSLMAGQLGYDAVKDFTPVTLLATVPNLLLVHPSVPASNVSELIAFAKANPGKLHYVSQGVGTSGHLGGEMFAHRAGIEMVHVPEKGPAQAQTSIIGGHTQILFDSTALSMPQVRAAKLKALAITSARRSPIAPQIPTLAEAGVSGCEFTLWFGVFAPAGVPPTIIDKLNREIVRIFNLPDVRTAFESQGVTVVASSPDALAAHQKKEIAYWAPIVKSTGASSQ
jgi:tripartite-type tricarboxylate transporter receptor subunit TctC